MASEPGIAAGHIHGRAFTTNLPGDFTVTFRAVDEAGLLAPSEAHNVLFRAIAPPPFEFSIVAGQARLRFTGRANLSYDVQRCTDLAAGVWDYVGFPLDGNGLPLDVEDPIGGVGHAVYRILEYR